MLNVILMKPVMVVGPVDIVLPIVIVASRQHIVLIVGYSPKFSSKVRMIRPLK